MIALLFVLNVAGAWILADAMSGVVHYGMDKWMPEVGLLSWVARDNELHHTNPRSILQFSYLQNAHASLPALPISALLFWAGAPTFLWLAFFFLTFGNIVHRWTHTPLFERPVLVPFLQELGILQSPQHHHKHHYHAGKLTTRATAVKRYCVMTNFLNPIIDRVICREAK